MHRLSRSSPEFRHTMSHPTPAPADRTLREVFRQRRLSVRTMDWTLKLATGAAVGCMLGAIVLIALRDRGDVTVTLGVTDGVRTIISASLFYATLALLAVGLGYLLSGLAMAHRVLGLTAVCVLTVAIGLTTGVVPLGQWHAVLPGWAAGATRGLLATIVLVAVAVMVLRRGRHGDHESDRRLRVVVLLVNVGLVGAYLVLLQLSSPTLNGLANFPATVDLIMINVALLVTPMLQIAALDVAEWGEVAAERIQALRALRPVTLPWLVPVAGCVALVVVGAVHRGSVARAASTGAQALLLLVAGLGLALVVGRLLRLGSRRWPERPNAAALFVSATLTLWVVVPVVGHATGALTVRPTPVVSEQGEFTAAASVRSLRTDDGGTLLLPTGWELTSKDGVDSILGVDPKAGVVRIGLARYSQQLPVTRIADSLGLAMSGRPTRDGELTRVDIALDSEKVEGQLWTAPAGGGTYVAYATVTGPDVEKAKLEAAAVMHSLRPAGQPPATLPGTSEEAETSAEAEQATTDRLLSFTFGVSLVLSVIALALVATVARRWATQVQLVLLIFPVVSLCSFLFFADSLGRVLGGPSTSWPYVTRDGLLISMGLLGVVALVVARSTARSWARRLPVTLTALVGATLALVGAEALYSQALEASRIAIWAAVVVLFAVAWDVVMSGESLTNHSSRLWSRSSRLLTFFGYIIMVAATVVYFSGQRAAGNGETVEAFFEPELVTRNAFFRFALPVVLLLFLLRTFCPTPSSRGHTDSTPVDDQSTPDGRVVHAP